MVNVFSVPVFFIVFRETTEASIIISVLLAFIKQGLGGPNDDKAVYKKLVWQIWIGAIGGLLVCFVIGGAFIGVFYRFGNDIWGKSEDIWEGIFALVAAIIITIMGIALLRINKMQEKWRVKLAEIMERKDVRGIGNNSKKYAMMILPFITVLREGIEAIVFVAGVSLSGPAKSFPLPVFCGLFAGSAVGFVIYKGGNRLHLQVFLVVSTIFLYLVAAALFTRSIWYFENYRWSQLTGGDASETGSGPGSYDIRKSVWHVNCCNPEANGGGGWGIFNAILGWQNSSTQGTIIGYCLYWLSISVTLMLMLFKEKKGYYPGLKKRYERRALVAQEQHGKSGEVDVAVHEREQELELR